MTKRKRIGCVVAAVAPIAIFSACFYYIFLSPFGRGLDLMLKSTGRGIWCAIITANAEREPKALKPLWPKDQGFNNTRSSTEYFRMLMSTETGRIATDRTDQLVSDLTPTMLGGHGVPPAETAAGFSSNNNAWIVICVDSNSPADTAFLISRNVDLGKQASSTSIVTFVQSPIKRPRNLITVITVGGGGFSFHPEHLTVARLFPDTNATYDVMYP